MKTKVYIKDHQGSNRMVVNSIGTINQHNIYYTLGGTTALSSGQEYQQYKYTDKEYDPMHGLNQYDFSARQYDPAIGRFTSIDPLAEKYYHLTPYSYCGGDPVNKVDPDGRHIEVQSVSDYQYKIVGGSANKDMNVYVDYGTKNQRSIGTMLTKYSFMDDKGKAIIGAIIDMSDRSGSNFLNGFIHDTPELLYYMFNATEWEIYDFKRTSGKYIPEEQRTEQSEEYLYRGMTIPLDGKRYIASARDIGNFAAGYIAGINDIAWGVSRIAFDVLETWQHIIKWEIGIYSEKYPTTYAQKMGYNYGQKTETAIAIKKMKYIYYQYNIQH